MSTNVQRIAWKRYLRSCADLGYDPEPTVETILLQRYTSLYHRYCKDNDIHIDQSKTLEDFAQIEKLSKLLYLDLCEEFGYECLIKIRRDLMDLKQYVYHRLKPEMTEIIYDVGSRAEGFRIETSDVDQMIILTDNLIVNDAEEIASKTVDVGIPTFIMEREKIRPGYVLLRAKGVSPSTSRVKNSLRFVDGTAYLSSLKFRNSIIPTLGRGVFVHGPCTTIKHGHREIDTAYCLKCTALPNEITSWKQRCKRFMWPSKDLVEECISLGCQLAPVGVKDSNTEPLEWRISFILMEKKLLFSLNHTQFMCYGLLKLFLKEVVNTNEIFKNLISSYNMKTVLFWEIHEGSDENWSSKSVVHNIRQCIIRLYTWVKTENCPNFFIPENNMFANKMESHQIEQLTVYLEKLLGEQFFGLYRCSSIDLPYLVFQTLINDHKQTVVSSVESDYVSKTDIDIHTWHEINSQFYAFLFKQSDLNALQTLFSTMVSVRGQEHLTVLEQTALDAWISEVSVYIASHELKKLTKEKDSFKSLEIYNACSLVFRNNDHPGSVALLYLATVMYITGRYKECLEIIIESNKRLKENYLQVVYFSNALQVEELRLELETTFKRKLLGIDGTYLHLDPSVYVCMLSVLCHHHLGFIIGSESEYHLLQEICSDIPFMKILSFQEISWQILGICAETIGKFEEAYRYYLKALKSPRFFLTDTSSLLRILCLLCKMTAK